VARTVRKTIEQSFERAALGCTQRFAVLEYLVRRHGHTTTGQILRAIDDTDPCASRATVHNNLRSDICRHSARIGTGSRSGPL
jgi:Fe2+ or Zn2+ uptake regulation protein